MQGVLRKITIFGISLYQANDAKRAIVTIESE